MINSLSWKQWKKVRLLREESGPQGRPVIKIIELFGYWVKARSWTAAVKLTHGQILRRDSTHYHKKENWLRKLSRQFFEQNVEIEKTNLFLLFNFGIVVDRDMVSLVNKNEWIHTGFLIIKSRQNNCAIWTVQTPYRGRSCQRGHECCRSEP